MNGIADVVNESLSDKRVLLFLGSGFSTGATNTQGMLVPTGGVFAKQLYDDCNIEGDTDLQYAAELYLKNKSKDELIKKLRDTFTIKDFNEYYSYLTKHAFFRVYTTNYDDLFEKITAKNAITYSPVTIDKNISGYKNKSKLVIHLNGYIENLNSGNMENYFKLTSDSYLIDTITQSSWYDQLKADISIADIIIFLGFSLENDLDIKRVIFFNDEIKQKTIFIVWEEEKKLEIEKLGRYGKVFPIGIKEFCNVMNLIPPIKKNEVKVDVLQCFSQIKFQDDFKQSIRDKDTFNLLFYGDLRLDILSIVTGSKLKEYALNRSELELALSAIESGESLIVHSDMGNGKSIFLYQLGLLLSKAGFNVFIFNKPYQSIYEEIEIITKQSGKTVILIDRYYQYFTLTKKMLKIGSPDLLFVLAERSALFDLSIGAIESILTTAYEEIDLNTVHNQDINNFIELINKYNFWGDYAKYTDEGKISLFINKHKKQFRLFLLDVLRSENMKSRINSLINLFSENENAFKLFILLLVTDIIGISTNVDNLIELLGYNIDISQMRLNASYREILDFGTGEVFLKSSILSQSMIELLENNNLLLPTIFTAAKNASKKQSTLAKNFIRQITMFSNLEAIFRNKTLHRVNIVNFYQLAKEFQDCATNPYFWVQYSIAMITLDDLNQADNYIRNAYAIADKKEGFDSTQIDNQYSRLLMERCIRENRSDHYDLFKKVHDIISHPRSLQDNKYYPFRVAKKYYDYYQKYFSKLDINQKKTFVTSCEFMHRAACVTLGRTTSENSKKKIKDFISTMELLFKSSDIKMIMSS